jgi:putative aldouronate transport system substrate-binding protein
MTDKVGMIVYWDNWIPRFNDTVRSANPGTSYQAKAIYPPVGSDGTSLLRRSGGAFSAIPAGSEYKDEAFEILEFFSTEEGALLGTGGVEGYDYNIENGKIVFTEVGLETGQNHGMKPGFVWDIPWEVSPEWLEAKAILNDVPTAEQQGYGRDEGQWEETTGADGARIIRGEITANEGLAQMRKRMIDLDLVDY